MAKFTPWTDIQGDQPPDALSVYGMPPQQSSSAFAPPPDNSVVTPALAVPQTSRVPDPFQQNLDQEYANLKKLQYKDTHPLGSPENHPGFLGKLGHVFGQIGNIAGDIVAPNTMALIPGTQLNRRMQEQELKGEISKGEQEKAENRERAAQSARLEEETAEAPGKAELGRQLTQSEITEHNAQATALLHPQAKTDFEAWQLQNPGKPIEEWLKDLQKYHPTTDKPDPARQQLVDEFQKMHPGATLGQANEYASEKLQAPQRPPQIMVLTPNAQGTQTAEVLRPGQTVAPGTMTPQQAGSATEKDRAAATSAGHALDYANSYMASKQFTGPGDEALQDQFFELAKPSTGFRMNQAQIDQLHKMQSWMNSAEGFAYHATTGTWFSPEQRQQIVQTMNALGAAKGATKFAGATKETREYQGHTYEKGDDGQWHLQKTQKP